MSATLTLKDARAGLRNAATAVKESVQEIESAESMIGRVRVRIGIQYVAVQSILSAQPSVYDGSWRDWAEAHYKGGPDVYRLMNAGHVATVLGDSVAEATERHLAPLYRILKSAEKGTDEEKEKAAAKVRSLWESLNAKRKPSDPMPSEEKILAAVDRATGTAGGTRGKAAGAGKDAGKPAARSTRKGRGQKVQEKAADPVETPGPDLGEKELRSLDSKVRTIVGRIEPDRLQGWQHAALAMVALCKTYGTDAVEAAIRTAVRDARKASRKAA